ncbi:hypothetical protein JAAARDRAFT_142926, partial [Jaapia argillacea MUCL 33604]
AGLNVKWVQKMAAERDPAICADFAHRIGEYPADYLVAIDKVSKDDCKYARLWGQSPIGQHCKVHAPFVQKCRFSMVAAMALSEGINALSVVEIMIS